MPEFVRVDPGMLHLPPGRSQGADPGKLIRQIAKYGDSTQGMPSIQVTRGRGGLLRINDGVTRATRAAKLRPSEMIEVEVIHEMPNLNVMRTPTIRETLP